MLLAIVAIVKEPSHLQILHQKDWAPTTTPYSFNSAMAAANTCHINYPLVQQCQTAHLSIISCIMVVDRNHLPSASMLQKPSTAAPCIVVATTFEEPLFGKDLAGI